MMKVIAVTDQNSDYNTTLVTPMAYKDYEGPAALRTALLSAHPFASRANLNVLAIEEGKLINIAYRPHQSYHPTITALAESPLLSTAIALLEATYEKQKALCELVGSLASRCGPDRLDIEEA